MSNKYLTKIAYELEALEKLTPEQLRDLHRTAEEDLSDLSYKKIHGMTMNSDGTYSNSVSSQYRPELRYSSDAVHALASRYGLDGIKTNDAYKGDYRNIVNRFDTVPEAVSAKPGLVLATIAGALAGAAGGGALAYKFSPRGADLSPLGAAAGFLGGAYGLQKAYGALRADHYAAEDAKAKDAHLEKLRGVLSKIQEHSER